jgi:hypothetical protein
MTGTPGVSMPFSPVVGVPGCPKPLVGPRVDQGPDGIDAGLDETPLEEPDTAWEEEGGGRGGGGEGHGQGEGGPGGGPS